MAWAWLSEATSAAFQSTLSLLTPKFHVNRYLDAADPVAAAFAAATANGRGEVVVPDGTWNFSTTLNWGKKIKLRGEGPGSRLHYTGSGVAVVFGSGVAAPITNADVVDDPDPSWAKLHITSIWLTGTAAATAAFRLRGATRYVFRDFYISGFTAGDGLLVNGGSFIGLFHHFHIRDCLRGINIQWLTGDNYAGAGQPGNALEFGGQFEIHNCTDAVIIGDNTAIETTSAAVSLHIHDGTIEGCTRGITNNTGYAVKTSKMYYELNTEYDEQIGSLTNTLTPVMHVAEDNKHNLAGTPVAYKVIRGDRTRIIRPFVTGRDLSGLTGVAATDIITKASHSLLSGTAVEFPTLTGGAGLSVNTRYYVINPTASTFQVSLTVGGAAINFTTDVTDATLVSGLAWTTRASTAQYTKIDDPRYQNLVTTPYDDAGNYTLHKEHKQVSGAAPFEQWTGGLVCTRGAFAAPIIAVAGAVSDAAITALGYPTPVNGWMAIDTTNFQIYVRFGGVWKKTVALT